MPKNNLFKAIIITIDNELSSRGTTPTERDVYVVADTIMKATTILCQELSVDEELKTIKKESEECYR